VKPSLAYVLAAGATASALVLPLWGFAMSAPQYPDETLHLQVTRTGIRGDVHEVATLQHYIGVRFPTDLPELVWATRGIVVLTGLLLVAASVRGRRLGQAYRVGCTMALYGFLLLSAAAVQARLYAIGHDRDLHAPIRAVPDFTPPLIGPVKVGNFTVWSFPHLGALMLLGAAVLAVIGTLRPSAAPSRTPRLHAPCDRDVGACACHRSPRQLARKDVA
jgi:hypothetical protein